MRYGLRSVSKDYKYMMENTLEAVQFFENTIQAVVNLVGKDLQYGFTEKGEYVLIIPNAIAISSRGHTKGSIVVTIDSYVAKNSSGEINIYNPTYFEQNFVAVDLTEKSEQRFEKELESLINRYSKESGSNTPDFILAEYLNGCLENFDKTMKGRENYYKNASKPEQDITLKYKEGYVGCNKTAPDAPNKYFVINSTGDK